MVGTSDNTVIVARTLIERNRVDTNLKWSYSTSPCTQATHARTSDCFLRWFVALLWPVGLPTAGAIYLGRYLGRRHHKDPLRLAHETLLRLERQ